MKLAQYIYIAVLTFGSTLGAVAAPVDVADPVAYDSRVELPKAETNDGPIVITSDYEEDETVVYTEK